ncbi:unnamed protein product [Rhizophagus irregularis]|nr:unnamed protein product [Rhizophagus irregularis]
MLKILITRYYFMVLWLNSWTRGNLMASSLDIFRDADYSVCRILTIGSFRRELFGWLEHMENLMIQVSKCLGIWDLGIWVKIIGFPTSWQGV